MNIDLKQVEIDTIQISSGCSNACDGCAQSPESKISFMDDSVFRESVSKYPAELFTNYIFASINSEPLLHPRFGEMAEFFYEQTGKKFYVLTSGWNNNEVADKNAEWIVKNSDKIERVSMTLSNFPKYANDIPSRAKVLSKILKTFSGMPLEKLVISPQYKEEDKKSIYSREQTELLLNLTLQKAGISYDALKERIFFRPIINLGRAKSFGVAKDVIYRIEAEQPAPIISTREEERPYSGMIALDGSLKVIEAPRGILNRSVEKYQAIGC